MPDLEEMLKRMKLIEERLSYLERYIAITIRKVRELNEVLRCMNEEINR